ncbi:SDR family NAD(P)-dependent oxidoreductase [Lutimaribacter sp. EGI FJ00015]|uniref:SDR family NAD(P)-dependent oxidoreductase n=1 Tax=Lutimaribacter degradans TaxID=2945989 RepID=A0ACC5ZYM0_9RHOB|nr:SDR family NAD(P)-dependent oxidoreductase [Lutimaribacter sp. EGI FJ00013]MCM2562925.1 SDR family NAD(P)-dependent oxidoreductase [Lutimaribacter sp. EGI FJ00013]MCO0614093.1 SDR family NAD(P)-dependent oxidoreductase [Lutimaribacter sp. EGI FJ00015]MCO0636070.1 SDR family NAD(P)-dependent oxidoreductase [Lutimaribacter sp. EGI FJ00014]
MIDWTTKTYWLIGASEGLGAALAHKISATGAQVILSARNAERLQELADSLPGPARILPMDVQDDDSVADAVAQADEIDGLVWLAGVYWPMPATDWDVKKGVAMADVNFTGAYRVLGRAVPPMVARDTGHIVLVGSLSGFRGLPGAIGYAPSKAGVMALGESLYADLHRTGLNVQLANPGFIRTRLTDKNDFKMPFLMEPEQAAQQVFDLMCTPKRFKKSFPTVFSWVFRLSQFLPDWIYYRLFA